MRRTDEGLTLDLSCPPTTTAEVVLPGAEQGGVVLNGAVAPTGKRLEVGPGEHRFVVTAGQSPGG
ncbi:MAG: alpha-L-rhamnosidase C-terminal domain-containing protein [Planctomycetota bacterium]